MGSSPSIRTEFNFCHLNISTAEKPLGVLDITLSLAPEDYVKDYREHLKATLPNVSLAGFRPGKVPRDVYEKRYGDATIRELAVKRANQTLNKFFSEKNFRFLLQPLWLHDNIGKASCKSPTEITVSVLGITEPQITIPDDFQVAIPSYTLVPPTEDALNALVEDILRNSGASHVVDKSSRNATITGEIQQNIAGEWVFWRNLVFAASNPLVRPNETQTTKDLANGVTVGFTVPFELSEFSLNQLAFASSYNLTQLQLEDFLSKESRFVVTKIEEKEIPPITPELQQKFFKKTFDSDAEFLDAFRKAVVDFYQEKIATKQKEDEINAILEVLNIQLPEKEIEFVLSATNEHGKITYAELIGTLRQMRMSIFIDSLKRKYPDEVELPDDELRDYLIESYRSRIKNNVPLGNFTETANEESHSEGLLEEKEESINTQITENQEHIEFLQNNQESDSDGSSIPSQKEDYLLQLIASISEEQADKTMKNSKQKEEAYKIASSEKIYRFISTNIFQREEKPILISEV